MYSKNYIGSQNIALKVITINPRFLFVKQIKNNNFFRKIIGYNNIK